MSGQKSHLKEYEKLKWKCFSMIDRKAIYFLDNRQKGWPRIVPENCRQMLSDLWEAKMKSANPNMLFPQFSRQACEDPPCKPKGSSWKAAWLCLFMPLITDCSAQNNGPALYTGLSMFLDWPGCHWMIPLSFIIFICMAFSKVWIYIFFLLSIFG